MAYTATARPNTLSHLIQETNNNPKKKKNENKGEKQKTAAQKPKTSNQFWLAYREKRKKKRGLTAIVFTSWQVVNISLTAFFGGGCFVWASLYRVIANVSRFIHLWARWKRERERERAESLIEI